VGAAENVPLALARVAVVVRAKLFAVGFDELVIVMVPHPAPEQPLGREVTVPTTLPGVALVVSVNVFEFAESPIVMAVLDAGALVKVPAAVSDVALVCRANPFDVPVDEFVTVMVWLVLFGTALKVPTALPGVALVVSVKLFELAESPIEIEVVGPGALAKVPPAVSEVALVLSVVTFAPFVIVIVLAADVGEAEKVPV